MSKLFFSPMMLAIVGMMFVAIAGINAAERDIKHTKVYDTGVSAIEMNLQEDSNGTGEE
jgi:hypothetical protein